MSLRLIADSAFVKLTRDYFGGSSRDHLAKMRAYFAKGLDKKATGSFRKYLTKLAVDSQARRSWRLWRRQWTTCR